MGEAYVIAKPRLLLRGTDFVALVLGWISTLFKAQQLQSRSNAPALLGNKRKGRADTERQSSLQFS